MKSQENTLFYQTSVKLGLHFTQDFTNYTRRLVVGLYLIPGMFIYNSVRCIAVYKLLLKAQFSLVPADILKNHGVCLVPLRK